MKNTAGSVMNNNKTIKKSGIITKKIKEEILRDIDLISFGEVVITIHDSRIVQIEKKEKTRFGK